MRIVVTSSYTNTRSYGEGDVGIVKAADRAHEKVGSPDRNPLICLGPETSNFSSQAFDLKAI